MTKRINDKFEELGEIGRAALVAYAVAGDPDPATGADILLALARHSDVLEIGVPCTRPFRDGQVIAAAHQRALAAGASWQDAVDTAAWLRSAGVGIPIILLLYAEAIKLAGPGPLFQNAAEAGVDGLLIVDFDEEALPWWAPMAKMAGLDLITLISSDMPAPLLTAKLERAEGFVYCAGASTTGGAAPDHDQITPFLDGLRQRTEFPRVLGFGIRTPEIAVTLASHAEGLAVGTAFVAAVASALDAGHDAAGAISALAKSFSRVLEEAG